MAWSFPPPVPAEPFQTWSFTQLLRRLKLDFVPHGLRSSFRDWAAEKANARHDVMETALAHTVGNASEAAYFRSDLFKLRRDLRREARTDELVCVDEGHTGTRSVP